MYNRLASITMHSHFDDEIHSVKYKNMMTDFYGYTVGNCPCLYSCQTFPIPGCSYMSRTYYYVRPQNYTYNGVLIGGMPDIAFKLPRNIIDILPNTAMINQSIIQVEEFDNECPEPIIVDEFYKNMFMSIINNTTLSITDIYHQFKTTKGNINGRYGNVGFIDYVNEKFDDTYELIIIGSGNKFYIKCYTRYYYYNYEIIPVHGWKYITAEKYFRARESQDVIDIIHLPYIHCNLIATNFDIL